MPRLDKHYILRLPLSSKKCRGDLNSYSSKSFSHFPTQLRIPHLFCSLVENTQYVRSLRSHSVE
jgi:hypothetical protein